LHSELNSRTQGKRAQLICQVKRASDTKGEVMQPLPYMSLGSSGKAKTVNRK